MKNKIKIMFVIAIVFSYLFSCLVHASSELEPTGNPSVISTYSEASFLESKGLLSQGSSFINYLGSGVMQIHAEATTTQECDEISYVTVLEKWNGSTWAIYNSNTKTVLNASSISGYHYKNVASGDYRL